MTGKSKIVHRVLIGFAVLLACCSSPPPPAETLEERSGPVAVGQKAVSIEEDEPAQPGSAAIKTEAIVSGRVITFDKIDREFSRLKKSFPDEDEQLLLWYARRSVATRALLAESAKHFAANITDEMIIQYWAEVLRIEEREIVDNLDEFRDDFLISHYLNGRMGKTQPLPGLSPDYADLIRVTPKELRQYYRYKYKSDEKHPATIRVAQYIFPRSAFLGEDLLNSAVQECAALLKEPPEEEEALKSIAGNWKGVVFRTVEILEEGPSSLRAELIRFARSGKAGEVSPPINMENTVVVQFVIERIEVKIPTFDACQSVLLKELQRRKENRVQDAIVRELIVTADFYPRDLFTLNAGKRPSRGGTTEKARKNGEKP